MITAPASAATDNRRTATLWVAVALAVLPWLPSFRYGLWLDETASRWVIDGSYLDVIRRTLVAQGQSPFYFLILRAVRSVLGTSEIALRFPSLIFLLAAVALVYRIGTRLMGREGGLFAALVYVSSRHITAEASDARPYALAQLVVVGSALALLKWCHRGRWRDGALYVVLAAAIVYAHCLYTPLLLAHLTYAIVRRRAGGPVSPVKIAVAVLGIAILLLPLVPHFLILLDRRAVYSYTGTPALWKLLVAFAPPVSVAAIVAGALAGRLLIGGARFQRPSGPPPEAVLLLGWLVTPPLALFLVSHLTAAKVFAPHYYMANEPAFALLAAWCILRLRPERACLPIAVALVLAGAANLRVRPPPHEDWRGASAALNRLGADGRGPLPVLCSCGFINAQADWLTDPARYGFTMGPFIAYPVTGAAQRLPGDLEDPATRDYFEKTTPPLISGAQRFALVSRGSDPKWEQLLSERFGPAGFKPRPFGDFSGVSVTLYERPAGE